MLRTVLVVDDEPEMRETLRRVLEDDYRVDTCCNGVEALKRLRETEKPIDVVMTDLKMPGMTGYELIVKIQEKTPAPSIIAMSAYFDDDTEMTEEIKKRAHRLLRKPLDLMEMKRAVAELMQARAGKLYKVKH